MTTPNNTPPNGRDHDSWDTSGEGASLTPEMQSALNALDSQLRQDMPKVVAQPAPELRQRTLTQLRSHQAQHAPSRPRWIRYVAWPGAIAAAAALAFMMLPPEDSSFETTNPAQPLIGFAPNVAEDDTARANRDDSYGAEMNAIAGSLNHFGESLQSRLPRRFGNAHRRG